MATNLQTAASESADLLSRDKVEERLIRLAESDLEQFLSVFRRLRKLMPEKASRACVRYLADRGNDKAGQQMSLWLSLSDSYFALLLDPDFLALPLAQKAAAVLRESDPWFFNRFLQLTEGPALQTDIPRLLRALGLFQGLGDYSVLLPWVKNATEHSDERVRSKAVRVLCELRPNSSGLDQHRSSGNARVRANAIEAIWHVKMPNAEKLFREALGDPHHRVVVNALLGLHYYGDKTAFSKLVEVARHPSPEFRAAAIWALGRLGDPRAVPVLEELSQVETEPLLSKIAKSLSILPKEPLSPILQETKPSEPLDWDLLRRFEPLSERKKSEL